MRNTGIILNSISVEKNLVRYSFSTIGGIENFFTASEMFLEYDTDVSTVPESVLAIPFVAVMMPVAWMADWAVWVRELDRTFYRSAIDIRAAYRQLYRHVDLQGSVVAAMMPENRLQGNDTALLFGGGIDAHCTLQRIKSTAPRLINIQGWYRTLQPGTPLNQYTSAAEVDFNYTHQVAQSHGWQASTIRSNFAVLINNDVFNKRFGLRLRDSLWSAFQHPLAFLSISVPLCWVYGINRLYIASSIPMGTFLMCGSHVTTDSEFRFCCSGECVHDGSELTRQDKVRVIVENAELKDGTYPLKVCSFHDTNCCACYKCLRTILGIVAEGRNIEDFGFHIEGSLKDYWQKMMDEKAYTFNTAAEDFLHWGPIRERMKENYENIADKEFVDWFMAYDFRKAHRRTLRRYYRKNFWRIVMRKVGMVLKGKKR